MSGIEEAKQNNKMPNSGYEPANNILKNSNLTEEEQKAHNEKVLLLLQESLKNYKRHGEGLSPINEINSFIEEGSGQPLNIDIITTNQKD